MGAKCGCGEVRTRIESSLILENINNFFKALKLREIDINALVEKIKSKLISIKALDPEEWKQFLNEELISETFPETSKELLTESMNSAKTTYSDQTLPLVGFLFLSKAEKDSFVNSFKIIIVASHIVKAGGNVQTALSGCLTENVFHGISQGLDCLKNLAAAAEQATNPDLIAKDDLLKVLGYYVNLITLLTVDILPKYKEGAPMKEFYTTILTNAFNSAAQNKYIQEEVFSKYNAKDKIDVNEFFTENYIKLKDDCNIRTKLVNDYLSTLTPRQKIELIKGKKKE